MQYLLILGNYKIYIKTYIKIAPTCFGPRPSSGSLHLSLAKVTLMLKQSVKLRRYVHALCITK
jgi:16S rRNA A1518/A1519 N6-dimethyltransferase RsmA/KsgA/DIM1 with predicted DNA glycosylase/AP lyase activity